MNKRLEEILIKDSALIGLVLRDCKKPTFLGTLKWHCLRILGLLN